MNIFEGGLCTNFAFISLCVRSLYKNCIFQDPYKGFGLPSVGRLTKYEEPTHIPGIRCDSGIREGSEISIYYDPLICKLVSKGKDRQEALNRMSSALDHYVIRGVTHNISLLRDVVNEKRFRSGNITTKYLPETYPEGFLGASLNPEEESRLIALVAALNARKIARARHYTNQSRQQNTSVNPFTNKYCSIVKIAEQAAHANKQFNVEVNFENGDESKARVKVDGKLIPVDGNMNLAQSVLELNVHGAELVTQIANKKPGEFTLIYKGECEFFFK